MKTLIFFYCFILFIFSNCGEEQFDIIDRGKIIANISGPFTSEYTLNKTSSISIDINIENAQGICSLISKHEAPDDASNRFKEIT